MSTAEIVFWLSIALLGLLGSAIWSGVETGFYCLSRVRLDIRLSDPHDGPARRVRAELSDMGRLLTTILLGNSVSDYMVTLGLTVMLEEAGLSEGLMVALQVLVLTPMLFVFSESLPKEVFRTNADTLPYRIAPFVALCRRLATFSLVLPVLTFVSNTVTRRLGGDRSPLESGGRRRLLHLLEESAHSGAISGVQGALAERALAFERSTVRDVMVPWTRVDRVMVETGRERAVEVAVRSGRSWLPLTDRRGRVMGVVHALDLLAADGDLHDLCREPARLLPDDAVRRAVGRLAEAGPGVAIVEEDGRPIGLVAEHDLVMPLIGTAVA